MENHRHLHGRGDILAGLGGLSLMTGRIASAHPSERHGWKSEVHGIFNDFEFGMCGTKTKKYWEKV